MTRKDRYLRKNERATAKKVVKFSILSLILAFLVLSFGIPFLAKFADLLDVVLGKKELPTVVSKNVPITPRVNTLPEATNSAAIAVSGFSSDANLIAIFLGGDRVGEAQVVDSRFKYELTLSNGENEIKALAIGEGGESDFSQTQKVTFVRDAPSLEITSPPDGATFSGDNRIKIRGKTEKDILVLANGFLATVGADFVFEVFVPLAGGENTIEVKATDAAGNSTTSKLKINYAP